MVCVCFYWSKRFKFNIKSRWDAYAQQCITFVSLYSLLWPLADNIPSYDVVVFLFFLSLLFYYRLTHTAHRCKMSWTFVASLNRANERMRDKYLNSMTIYVKKNMCDVRVWLELAPRAQFMGVVCCHKLSPIWWRSFQGMFKLASLAI